MPDFKRRLLLIDDLISSEKAFWSSSKHGQARENFESSHELKVFDYETNKPFFDELDRIHGFLRSESGIADVLLLDMNFPGNERGGLKILEFISQESIDIPIVIIVSNLEDQGLAVELAGYAFVHRENNLDLPKLTGKIDELFKIKSLDHPERGILITHGTDTLAYLLEFLRYGITGSDRANIVATGSQIPMGIDGAASDAIDNVRSSVLLLQHMYSPQLGVVFNRGEKYYRTNIQKISKWHPIAFEGVPDVTLDWDRFRPSSQDIRIHNAPRKLKELILLRTGGTIESVEEAGRGYIPAGDFVASFISGNLANCYEEFRSIPFTALDSSNMTISDWIELLKLMKIRCNIEVDTRFEPRIGLLLPSPLTTSDDYAAWIDRFKGLVIVGYGAGNANILEDNNYSLLRVVEKVSHSKPIVLASIVPREFTDFAYEVGRKFIEVGCIPAGHMSFQSCQVKLSWLLGHQMDIDEDLMDSIRLSFVEDLDFRSAESAALYQEIIRESDNIK